MGVHRQNRHVCNPTTQESLDTARLTIKLGRANGTARTLRNSLRELRSIAVLGNFNDLKERPMDKNKIATGVGFAGGGIFFILNLVTKGQVPGGFIGGVVGFIIGYALARLVLAFIPSKKKTEGSESTPPQ